MLSSRFSLSLFAFAGALLLASSVSALSLDYSVTGNMNMTNQVCTVATPCNVAVTGTMTLNDDEAGNVTITAMNLAHVPYEVASPALLSVQLERTTITLGAGSAAGTGSTLSSAALFGSTLIAQWGAIYCVPGFIQCVAAGFPPGPGPMSGPLPPNPDPSPTALGSWAFDAFRNFTSGAITYTNTVVPQTALETLTLTGTLIPEPGTALLTAVGLLGMALRRRAVH